MNRVHIIAVGKIKEKYLTEGIREFVKRLGPLCKLEILEVDEERMPDDPSPAEKAKVLATEGERLLKKVPAATYLIVLDVAGQAVSFPNNWRKKSPCSQSRHGDITFIIGGAFGLSPAVTGAGGSACRFTHDLTPDDSAALGGADLPGVQDCEGREVSLVTAKMAQTSVSTGISDSLFCRTGVRRLASLPPVSACDENPRNSRVYYMKFAWRRIAQPYKKILNYLRVSTMHKN